MLKFYSVQVSLFRYRGSKVLFEKDDNIQQNVNEFNATCGTTHGYLKNKTRVETRMKFYETVTVGYLLHYATCVRSIVT